MNKPDTALFRAPTRANPFLPPDFEATLRRQFGETQWARQELDGEFVSMEGAEWGPDVIDRPGRWFTDWPDDLVCTVIALDPSKGAREDSDYQAHVVVRMDRNATFWVDAVAERGEGVSAMIAKGIELNQQYRPHSYVVENNDGLGMLVTEFRRQFRDGRILVPITAVTNTLNKVFRIRQTVNGYLCAEHPELGPQLRIRDTPGGRLLVAQLRDFPLGEFDDCIDALEMALRQFAEIYPQGTRR